MNDIAIFFNDKVVYMHGIIMMLAVFAVVCCAAGLRTMQKGDMKSFAVLTAAAIPAGLLMSRFMYGFFALEAFSLIPGQMLSGNGGNSLLGAALGVLIVLLAAKLLRLTDSAADILDCLAPAAALGLCVGRLSATFSADDRGFEIPESEAHRFITVFDEASGQYVLAIYAYESIFAGILFAATLLFFMMRYRDGKLSQYIRRGDTALVFLAGFGGSQGVLESMRTDALTVIGFGFVRVLQITALLCLLIPVVVFSVRAVRATGVRKTHIACWVGAIAMLALAIFMEFTLAADFAVQERNYGIMANCLICVQLITAVLFTLTCKGESTQAANASPARAALSDQYPPQYSQSAEPMLRKSRNSRSQYWD